MSTVSTETAVLFINQYRHVMPGELARVLRIAHFANVRTNDNKNKRTNDLLPALYVPYDSNKKPHVHTKPSTTST